MIHIHPFPARMAPEIALDRLRDLPRSYTVLDPMSGSGMVLGAAAKTGMPAIGFDIDPLACLISKTNGVFIKPERVRQACGELLQRCDQTDADGVALAWVDEDKETQRYIDYWFADKQKRQLRVLSYYLIVEPFCSNKRILNALKVAVSRLIVTKESKASLARDTAHSRPHRVKTENDFNVFSELERSLEHVLRALEPDRISVNSVAYRGDARRMRRIRDASVDCIVTSPPYLNAIDYMRGHRLSLVWLGYTVGQLRKIRSGSVGTESAGRDADDPRFQLFLDRLSTRIDERRRRHLARYYRDLCALTDEAFRVLKDGRTATYVIGNSRIRGCEVDNSELLLASAERAGFKVQEVAAREIPENKRYMPATNTANATLKNRMKTENVVVLRKGR